MTESEIERIALNTQLALRAGFTARSLGQKVFVLSQDSTMHILENRTASFLWRLLEEAGCEGIDAAKLAHALEDRFDVTDTVAQRDSLHFVRELSSLQILDLV